MCGSSAFPAAAFMEEPEPVEAEEAYRNVLRLDPAHGGPNHTQMHNQRDGLSGALDGQRLDGRAHAAGVVIDNRYYLIGGEGVSGA